MNTYGNFLTEIQEEVASPWLRPSFGYEKDVGELCGGNPASWTNINAGVASLGAGHWGEVHEALWVKNPVFSAELPRAFSMLARKALAEEPKFNISETLVFTVLEKEMAKWATVAIGRPKVRKSADASIIITFLNTDVAARPSFIPSVALAKFVKLESDSDLSENSVESFTHQAAEHIKSSVFGLIQTIVNARCFDMESKPYQISDGNRFNENFARAILFRVPVGLYDSVTFLEKLHLELLSSGVRANNWRLERKSSGEAVINVELPEAPKKRATRTRAKSVRLAMTRFPAGI